MGIGLGIIVGSFYSIAPKYLNKNDILISRPKKKNFLLKNNELKNRIKIRNYSNKEIVEIKDLSKKWKELAMLDNNFEASGYIFFEDGRYALLNPNKKLPAASTIKVGILFFVLQELDQGKLKWDEYIKLNNKSIAGGSGWMRYQNVGKKFPVHEIATEMIRISDNTATNLLIERIGGINEIYERFKSIGLLETELNNLLPDLQGTNTTSAKDLATLIKIADEGDLISKKSRDIFRAIMSTSITNKLIPDGILNGLGIKPGNSDYKLLIQGFRIYNKTGDIGITYADSALLEMPDTSRAFAAFIVKGPFNDQRSTKLIRDMSAAIVTYLKSPNENP